MCKSPRSPLPPTPRPLTAANFLRAAEELRRLCVCLGTSEQQKVSKWGWRLAQRRAKGRTRERRGGRSTRVCGTLWALIVQKRHPELVRSPQPRDPCLALPSMPAFSPPCSPRSGASRRARLPSFPTGASVLVPTCVRFPSCASRPPRRPGAPAQAPLPSEPAWRHSRSAGPGGDPGLGAAGPRGASRTCAPPGAPERRRSAGLGTLGAAGSGAGGRRRAGSGPGPRCSAGREQRPQPLAGTRDPLHPAAHRPLKRALQSARLG